MENKKKTKETDKTGFKIPFQPSQTWKEQHYKCSWAAVLWWANLTVLKEMFASFRCWKTNQVIKLSTSWNVSPACKQNNSKIQKKKQTHNGQQWSCCRVFLKTVFDEKKNRKKTHTYCVVVKGAYSRNLIQKSKKIPYPNPTKSITFKTHIQTTNRFRTAKKEEIKTFSTTIKRWIRRKTVLSTFIVQ